MAQGFINQQNIVLPLAVSNGGTGVTTSTGSGANVLGTAPTVNQPNLVGVTTVSNAAAGSLGELISSVISFAGRITLTHSIQANVTSISLTAGDWDVVGNVNFATSIGMTAVYAWTNTVSATITDPSEYNCYQDNAGTLINIGIPTQYRRVNVSSTTTVYLSALAGFGSGSTTACGGIYARRVR